MDREDRQIWKNDTVLRAFAMKSLDGFKAFTEEGTGDKADDPIWIKRWDTFVTSVYAEKTDERKKKLITHFLTAQRTKRYRRKQPQDSSPSP